MLYALQLAATWGPSLYYSAGAITGLLEEQKQPTFKNEKFSNVVNQVKEINTSITFSRFPNGINGEMATNGTNLSPESFIMIDKKFEQLIKDTNFELPLLHELGHIINNDLLVNPLLATVGSLVSTLALPLIKSMLPGWLQPTVYALPLLIGTKIFWISRRNCERRADNFACEKATNDQLLDAERYFLVDIDLNKDINKHERNSHFSEEGNAPSDNIHPSSNERLNAIRKEMKKRKLQSPKRNSYDEKLKMQEIRDYLIPIKEKLYNSNVVGTIRNIKKYN